MIDPSELQPGDQVYVAVAPEIIRHAEVLGVDEVYESQVAVRLISTGALRTLPLAAVLERYPVVNSPALSSSTTSAS